MIRKKCLIFFIFVLILSDGACIIDIRSGRDSLLCVYSNRIGRKDTLLWQKTKKH